MEQNKTVLHDVVYISFGNVSTNLFHEINILHTVLWPAGYCLIDYLRQWVYAISGFSII